MRHCRIDGREPSRPTFAHNSRQLRGLAMRVPISRSYSAAMQIFQFFFQVLEPEVQCRKTARRANSVETGAPGWLGNPGKPAKKARSSGSGSNLMRR